MRNFLLFLSVVTLLVSCRISYGFRTASIDYTKIKTMNISDFPNQASRVYPPLSQMFSDHLKDVFTRNTKLSFVTNQPADLELEGEIFRYDLTPLAVKEDGYAGQTRLTMGVRIRFVNNVNPTEDREESLTTYRDFDSNLMLEDVQDQLIDEMNKELVDQIFNVTLSNW